MNRKLLALAVTAALAAPMAAQAAPTVYGQLNMSVDMVDWDDGEDDDREVQVNSNSSRLGVKGEEALGNGYSAVYEAEWGVAGDIAGATDLTGRDRYLGLKGSWGTVKLGAYDSPLKTSQGMVDQFNDMTYTDMGNFITGENRLNNVIGYESPKIADVLTVNLALQSGEATDVDEDDDGMSVSVAYEAGGLYLAAAVDNDIVDGMVVDTVDAIFDALNAVTPPLPGAPFFAPPGEDLARDTIRLTGGYSMDALQFGALIQTSEFADDDRSGFDLDEQSFLVSAAYTAGKNVFKGQIVVANYESDDIGDDIEATAVLLGMDHNFTAMTKAFAQVGMSQLEFGDADVDMNVLTVGMQTKF